MKLRHYIYTVLAALLMLTAAACSPEKDEMGAVDLTTTQINQGSGFSVVVDENNYATFTSLLSSAYTVYWQYGPKPADGEDYSISGTSTSSSYKVGIAFPGDYYVRMGVMTRGGIIYSDPYIFNIAKMNTALISDELWTMLTGGVGNSKTWVLDLDPNNAPTYALKFGGPKWFYTSGQTWDSFHNAQGQNYIDADAWDATTAIDPSHSGDWYWGADYAGNSWMCGLADYGEMTFDLINGANVDVNGTKGSFNMDVDAHTISFTGVLPLNVGTDIAAQCPSGTYKLIYLTENAMQILFDGTAETPYTMNYISKEYRDNYVAPVVTDITLPDEWRGYIEPFNQKTTTYKFDEDEPFIWSALDGEDIAGRTSFDANPNIGDAQIEMNWEQNTMKITDPDGNVTTATYELSDNGVFTLSEMPSFAVSTNENIKFANQNNELQVIKYEVSDMTGDITDLYLGSKQYDAQGNAYEYLTYHLKKQTGGAQVESFTVTLGYSDTGWAFITYDPVYVTGEGNYTFTIKPDGVCNTQSPYLYYIDVVKLLKKHPNADITITSIKADGKEILGTVIGDNTFDDAFISRGTGDDAGDGRRYLLNPWNEASATFTDLFKFSTQFDVTVNIKYDTGDVVLK